MRISKGELLRILLLVKPGLATRRFVEEATRLFFTGRDIVTYNEKICVLFPFETEFICSVDAEKIYKLLSTILEEEISLSLVENSLEISGKEFRATFVSFAIAEEESGGVQILTPPKDDWRKLPSDLMEGLFLCKFSTSKDVSIKALTGVYISGNIIVSSDDLRISRYTMRRGIVGRVLIPASTIEEMEGYTFIEYVVDAAWIYFRTTEGIVFAARKIEGEYAFDWEEFFDISGIPIEFPTDLKYAINTVSILAEGEFDLEKKITIVIDGENIFCKGAREQGCIQMKLVSDSSLPVVSFSINPLFFSQMLDRCTSMFVGNDKAWFKAEKFEHVMALPLFSEDM